MIATNYGTQVLHMLKMTWCLTMENVGKLLLRAGVLNQVPGYKMEMTFGKNVIIVTKYFHIYAGIKIRNRPEVGKYSRI